MEATRYLHKLRARCAEEIQMMQRVLRQRRSFDTGVSYGLTPAQIEQNYTSMLNALDDPNTKRILFDARQAALFDALDETIPENFQSKLRLPFPSFYLEFTEPIECAEPEPEHEERLLAFLVTPAIIGNRQVQVNELPLLTVTLFFDGIHNEDPGDRTWYYALANGKAYVHRSTYINTPDPSEVDESIDAHTLIEAGYDAENRYVGWFERSIIDHSALLSWILTYLMAKSIVIEAEPLSRQVRRWHEQHNKIPQPWHIVKLDLKIMPNSYGEATGEGSHHSYRYDVIGFLRFGRHKRGDGSYAETVEWVAPHQRGLANTLYIPKTYLAKGGKTIAGPFKRYMESS